MNSQKCFFTDMTLYGTTFCPTLDMVISIQTACDSTATIVILQLIDDSNRMFKLTG